MATPKPTPEEKLFAVIQGAKAPPIRGRSLALSLTAVGQQVMASVGPVDLPRINQVLTGVMVLLGACAAGQLFLRPSVNRLMARSEPTPPFRIAAPLEGLQPFEEYLPRVLERDPFRVGQTPAAAIARPEPSEPPKPDPKAALASLRLVGIAWGGSPTAMIEQDKQTYFLKPGDAIGPFTVKEILRDHVILRAGDNEVELF